MTWLSENWQFCVTSALLIANLLVWILYASRSKRRVEAEMGALESRLKSTVSVQKHLGSTWAERHAALKEQSGG